MYVRQAETAKISSQCNTR